MNRPVSIALLVFGLCAFPASAVLDSNQNGLSDLWEMTYNGGTLPNPGFDPLDDPDADGWTNAQEAAAGTSPFDANAADGIVRPQITHIPEVLGVTPEAVIITWPTNLGKQYTLLYSPDLVEWLPVPNETFIGNGSIVEYNFTISQDDKLFWRVQIEDADSDGDGLTNTEEHELGTDPNNSHTVTGYPDMWLATHFLNTLLNGGPSSFDPNDDPDHDGLTNSEEFQHETDPNNPDTDGDYLMDGWEVDHGFDPTNPDENNNGILDGLDDNDGDGLTNEQEQAAGTDPAEEDGEDIGKEAIINGDFSDPVLGSTPSNSSDSTWDYWAGVTGWTADTGSNIEFQNIESTGTNGQYVELKAHPEEHYGICQQVATRVGVTYLLSLDCKIRNNTEENNNIFTLKITGIADQSITPTSTWATQVVSFVATTVLTEIKLVPKNGLDDTMGCLVDNVKLAPVEIVPDEDMSGVIGDVVKSSVSGSNIKHFVTPKVTTELAQDYVILKVTGLTTEQISPGSKQIFEWNNGSVGEAVTGEPLKWKVKRDTADKYPLKIRKKNDSSDVAEMDVWVVWSTLELTKILDATPCTVNVTTPNPPGLVGVGAAIKTEWKFEATLQPASIIGDPDNMDYPDLSGPSGSKVPHFDEKNIGDGRIFGQPNNKWDISRQMRVRILSPQIGTSDMYDLLTSCGGTMYDGLPNANIIEPAAINAGADYYPSDPVEGNDNSPSNYKDTDPYKNNVGKLTDTDPPCQPFVINQTPALGSEIEIRMQFREFCRLEIGGKWYRISEHKPWRLHGKLKKVWNINDDTDGDGKQSGNEGKMRNNGSVSDATNDNW